VIFIVDTGAGDSYVSPKCIKSFYDGESDIVETNFKMKINGKLHDLILAPEKSNFPDLKAILFMNFLNLIMMAIGNKAPKFVLIQAIN